MDELTFERALYELEKIVNTMEKEELSLDETLKLYEQGVKLSSFCKTKLDEAQIKIETIEGAKEENKEASDD